MSGLPGTVSPVSDEEIREHLGRRLGAPVATLTRRPSRYATSATLEDVHVELADRRSLRLMLKDLSRAALLEGAARHKPAFLYDPRREIEMYRQVLARADLGTAHCYVAAADPGIDRFWLLLEKVPGVELYQVGELERWEAAARWLARMHRRLATLRDEATVPWLEHDDAHYRRWAERAIEAMALRAAPEAEQLAAWLRESYDGVVQSLLELPRTVIHGDFHASNVLLGEGPLPRVAPVDWEMSALGPGLADLAALLSGGWDGEARARIARAYRAGSACWQERSDSDFLSALTYCRLAHCVQWLGWAPAWTPPPEHAHDWLGEALRLIEAISG